MRLRENVIKSIMEHDEEERLRILSGYRDRWTEIVHAFYATVEDHYLSELVREGIVTTSRRRLYEVKTSTSPAGSQVLVISFGNTAIRLTPHFSPNATIIGYINVRVHPDSGREQHVVCHLKKGWLAPARETGLRSMLVDYLPENLLPIDEGLFQDLLADLIEADEPVFNIDRDGMTRRLSLILDRIVNASRDGAVTRFLSDLSVGSTVRTIKQVSAGALGRTRHRLSHMNLGTVRLLPDYTAAEPDGEERTNSAES